MAEACLIGARETPKQEGWFAAGLGLSSGSIPECRPCYPPTPPRASSEPSPGQAELRQKGERPCPRGPPAGVEGSEVQAGH